MTEAASLEKPHHPLLLPFNLVRNILKSRLSGDLLTAESENYDTVRSLWNLSVIQRPAVIVVAETASDILEAVRFAKYNDLKIAVTNTGHGAALPANDSMLIVVSSMNGVEIDPDKKIARVEAGANRLYTRWRYGLAGKKIWSVSR